MANTFNPEGVLQIETRLRKVEDRIYLAEELPKRIGKAVAEEIAKVSISTTQRIWARPLRIELDKERKEPQPYGSFPQGGDCIVYLPGSTGIVNLYLDSSLAFAYTMPPYTKIRAPFTEIYISNTAQQGAVAYLLVGRGDFDIGAVASKPQVFYIDMPNADTEYSQALPNGTIKFTMWCTDGTPFRFAWEPGHVAGKIPPYGQVIASAAYWDDGLYLIGKTLYFATSYPNKAITLQCYTSQ